MKFMTKLSMKTLKHYDFDHKLGYINKKDPQLNG